eukprot:887597_1
MGIMIWREGNRLVFNGLFWCQMHNLIRSSSNMQGTQLSVLKDVYNWSIDEITQLARDVIAFVPEAKQVLESYVTALTTKKHGTKLVQNVDGRKSEISLNLLGYLCILGGNQCTGNVESLFFAVEFAKFIHIYTANLFYSPYRYSDEQYKQLFKHEIAAANLGLKLLLSNFAVNDYTAACIASFGTTARFMHEEYGIAPGALKRQGGERKNYLIKLQAMCTDHKEPPLDLAHCNKETDDPFKQEITIPEALQQPQSIATSQVLERSTMLHLGHKDYNNTRWGMNLKESRDLKEKHDEFKDCDILALAKQKTDELLELSTNNVFKNYFFAFNKWDALKGEKSSFNDKHVARVSSLYSASMGLKASSNKKAAGTTSTAASNKNDMETATSNNKKKTASNDTTNNTIAFEESSSDESDTNSSDSSSYEASSADSDSEEFTAVKGTRKRMARSTNKNVKKQCTML